MYLEIVSLSIETEPISGIKYKKLGYAPLTFLPNGKQVLATGRVKYRNVWGDVTRSINGVDTVIKGDMLYQTASVGEVVEGQIATFDTKSPYEVNGNTVNQITVVAFKGESPAVLAANLAQVAVIDEDDNIVMPTKKRNAAPAPLVGAETK